MLRPRRTKRAVYSFDGDEGLFLKYIAWQLYQFDDVFCENCYAFHRFIGAKNAMARILRENRVKENGQIIRERHGAMAGIPLAPFFANVYLKNTNRYFHDNAVSYFRYSDDILLFADSREELARYQSTLYSRIRTLGLEGYRSLVHAYYESRKRIPEAPPESFSEA